MTHDQFIKKWNGQFIDYDGSFGTQCVDLMRQYVKDVYGVNPYVAIPQTGNAKDIFKNFKDNQYFTKIVAPYGDPKIPQKGDIVFWGFYLGVTGWTGHVAICSDAGQMRFISFDQNYSNPKFCRYVNHNYRGVMGWLRKK